MSERDLPTTQTLESAVEHVTDNVGKNGQRWEHSDELLKLLSQTTAAGYLEPDSDDGDTPYRVYQPNAAEVVRARVSEDVDGFASLTVDLTTEIAVIEREGPVPGMRWDSDDEKRRNSD